MPHFSREVNFFCAILHYKREVIYQQLNIKYLKNSCLLQHWFCVILCLQRHCFVLVFVHRRVSLTTAHLPEGRECSLLRSLQNSQEIKLLSF